MEIINLHKRCNKKVPQPKKAPFKSDGPKEAPKSLEYIDNLSEEEQKSKKNDGKKTATKSEKKLKCLTVEKSTKVTSIYWLKQESRRRAA